MPRLLLVRHGDTDFNTHRRFMGHTDIELSSLGIAQVTKLRQYLAGEKIHAVFSSDLARTMKTADIITVGRGLEITPCLELREVNYGDCEGLSFSQINERYPLVAANCVDFSLALEFPGGEGFPAFIARTRTFIKRLKHLADSETALVVSHSGPLKVLVSHFIGLPMKYWNRLHLDTASLSIVYYNPPNRVLMGFNDTSYLRDVEQNVVA